MAWIGGMPDNPLRYFLSIMTSPSSGDSTSIMVGIELDIDLLKAVSKISGQKIKEVDGMTIETVLDSRKDRLIKLLDDISFYEVIIGKGNKDKPQLMSWVYDDKEHSKFHLITVQDDYVQWVTVEGGHTVAYNSFSKMLSYSYIMDAKDYYEIRNLIYSKLEDKYNEPIRNLTDGHFDY
jgi:hypothetical protein